MIKLFIFLSITNLIIIIYCTFILYFFFYIYKNAGLKIKLNNIKYNSIIKDMKYIIFKNNLFNFYYTTIILNFIFIFRVIGFNFLLEFNNYFILFLIIILVVYSILLTNFFNLKLFKFYLEIKNLIKIFNEINFNSPYTSFSTQTKGIINKFYFIFL